MFSSGIQFGDVTVDDFKNDAHIDAVVISITKDTLILMEEIDHFEARHFKISPTSVNVSQERSFPRMREFVKIREISTLDHSVITKFEYSPGNERVFRKQEIMAVAQVTENYITLVGKSIHKEVDVCASQEANSFSVGQLVVGDLFELPPFVEACKPDEDDQEDVVYYKTNFCQLKYGAKTPRPILYPENLRSLTPTEEQKVCNRCVDVPNIELHEAQRFIQEPLIAAGLLEKYLQYHDAQKYTVATDRVTQGIDRNGTPTLVFYVEFATYTHLFQSVSPMTWRVGGELQMVHERIGKADLIIRSADKSSEQYRIELHSSTRSRDVLKAAFRHQEDVSGDFVISTHFHSDSATIESVRNNFDDFFLKRRAMFDQCTGRVEKPEVEVKNKDEPFLVNGRPLDASQLDFMRSAASTPGFTCAQAPPGCGKTHTTSALVSYLKELNVKGGICISGTTNAAVTNAADAVVARFPEIRVAREYSAKAEVGISATSQRASLKHMAEEAEKYLDLGKQTKLMKDMKMMQYARENFETKASHLRQQLSQVKDVVKLAKNVKKSFVEAYDLQVYATTVELLIRRGDVFCGRSDEEDKSLRRLILDEAAQMSPLEAMALYCTFPHLEYITLLGDMKQLGPHCSLPQESMCHKLISEGELTRMYKLKSTTKKELNTIYRCHPDITKKFLVPIYGPQIKCGASAASRSLAQDHNLLTARDGSPCVVIDVNGREEKGKNPEELKTALNLIRDIVDVKGIPSEDVVVICNHKAQMNCLNQELRGQGEFGPLKTKVAVHTIDSFQGKEAKVVIVLTTKTCGYRDDGKQKMKFVGDAARGTVAVSRAQHALYILGHRQSLGKTDFWRQFLKNSNVVSADIINGQPSRASPTRRQSANLSETTERFQSFTVSRSRKPSNFTLNNFISYSTFSKCPPIC